MPKELVNNRINYSDRDGRIIQHDMWLDQSLKSSSSPTFGNLHISGDTVIDGNLYVGGNTTVLNNTVIQFQDNIINLNDQETGAGITLNQGGIELDRGLLENYRFVYDESYGNFRVGVVSNLQPVTIREDGPLEGGVMVWNTAHQRIEARNNITIAVRFSNNTNATSSTSASIVMNGGLGIQKDLFIDGKINLVGTSYLNKSVVWTDTASNSLNVSSVQNINLLPFVNVTIPYNKSLIFGDSNQGIIANNITNNLSITSAGDINLTPATTKKINIPNQIPITFSTQNEKILTDGSNNMVIESSQNIILRPANGAGTKNIQIPVNTPLIFNNVNQQLIANNLGDLSINAGNNILLNPGSTLNVRIPTDNGIKFGGSGNQRIFSNGSDQLNILSSGDLFLTPLPNFNVNIPSNIKLTFSNSLQNLVADITGTLFINANKEVNVPSILHVSNASNSSSPTNGSVIIDGGLGISKDIVCGSNIYITSANTSAFNVNNTLFNINSSSNGKISINAGDGNVNNPSLEITNKSSFSAKSLISLSSYFDNTLGYMIGRGRSNFYDGRTLTVNIPSYSAYGNAGSIPRFCITSLDTTTELFSVESDTGNIFSSGVFTLANSLDAYSSTEASFVMSGGLGVVKSIYTSGKIINSVDSNTAFQVQNGSNNILFNIDSLTNTLTINQDTNINKSFVVSDNLLHIAFDINTTTKRITNNYQTTFTNTIDSTNTSTGCVLVNGGVAIQKALNVNGYSSFKNGINMLNTRIENILDPVSPQDSATKAYVDLVKQGLFVKDSVKVATTAPFNLLLDFINGNVIDNYTLIIGDRILIKDQSDQIENGIYTITNSTPTRTTDLSTGYSASGIFVFVENGDINSSLGWICNSPTTSDIVDTNPLNFTQFTGLGQVTDGSGLSKTFNTLNVNVDNYSIEIDNDILRLSNSCISTGITGGSGSPLQTSTNQSHVTKLGTINTGIWQASNIAVGYGGTGRNILQSGNILFGNDTSQIGLDNKFYYDTVFTRLGLGTSNPLKDFHIQSSNTASIFIDSDSDAINFNANPELILSYSSSFTSTIAMTRNIDQYATGILADSFVLSNNQTDTTSTIQLATNQLARFTILSNGNIGINTNEPNYNLDIFGTLNASGLITFTNTRNSTSAISAAVVMTGGLSIRSTSNSVNNFNGGALTINGGASILKDLYVGGSINVQSGSSTFAYLTITATDESINLSTGSVVTFGGITIQCTTDSGNSTNGGSLLTPGGAAIGKKLYVGSTLIAEQDAYLYNLYITSTSTSNFIMSPNITRNTNSFNPIYFTEFNNTSNSILTVSGNNVVVNKTLQIGGTLNTPDGYAINYTSNNLNIIPNSTVGNYNINIGTIGNLSNLNIYGNNSSKINWNSTSSNLKLTQLDTELINSINSSSSIILTTPNISGTSFIKSIGGNMTLNLGSESSGGQLTTILSNNIGNSSITFTPSNITNSTLVLTDNVTTQFFGPTILEDRVEFSGNTLHQTINNTSGSSQWIYFGKINNGNDLGYTEIDFIDGHTLTNINTSGLKLQVSVNGTNSKIYHQHYGSLQYNSNNKPIVYIYKNNIDNSLNLFCICSTNSKTNVNITSQYNTKFLLVSEGYSTVPNGLFSGYIGSWNQVYTTNIESNLPYTFGDTTIEGTNVKIADNLPIIGYNNNLKTSSSDIGLLFQRYQKDNDTNLGDIISDTPIFIDTIISQTGVPINQIKFSNSASLSDDFYKGYWLKNVNTNEIRQIINYNGAQNVATVSSDFTTQPQIGDTINLYNLSYAVNYYDSVNDTFALSYTSNKSNTISVNQNANLRLNHLFVTDTTTSLNSSTGSIYTLGGISINNTNDSTSSTQGMTFTTLGGIGIRKNVRVGNNIGIGSTGFIPQESLHIKKSINDNNLNSTIRLENDSNAFSYIDLVENTSGNRYGILLDSSTNLFSLTNTTSGVNPPLANKAFTINNLGFIGINTTDNITSPITLKSNNFISTNNTSGFLGLIGGPSNTNNNSNSSRILLNANGADGSLQMYTGNVTSGNINMYTGNDIKALNIDNNGIVTIFSTKNTKSSTSGSLVVTGGIAISSTENSISVTSGGALTVKGGISLQKDLYVGGNLYINGIVSAGGSVVSPTIIFSNPINCTFNNYNNNNLTTITSMGILTFGFSVIPTADSLNTQIEFSLPGRTNILTNRSDVVVSVSGYTDDTNVITLFNVIGVGVLNETRALIKFQSVSTGLHYFQVSCQYILS
jgi:hypothetical protein